MSFLVYPSNNALATFGPISVKANDFDHISYLDGNGFAQTQGYEFYKNKTSRKVVAYFSSDDIAGFVRVDD